MTEADWLACRDPEEMLVFLAERASPRKSCLFACGCCRRVIRHLRAKESRRAVEVAEAFADGLASEEELEKANNEHGGHRQQALQQVQQAEQSVLAGIQWYNANVLNKNKK